MTTATPRHHPSVRVPGLVPALLVTGVLAALASLVAALVAGLPQVLGALVGAGLVWAFFLFGAVSVGLVSAYAPGASLLVALVTYTLQVVLLAVAFVAVERLAGPSGAVDVSWVAVMVILGTVGWMAALVRASVREVRG